LCPHLRTKTALSAERCDAPRDEGSSNPRNVHGRARLWEIKRCVGMKGGGAILGFGPFESTFESTRWLTCQTGARPHHRAGGCSGGARIACSSRGLSDPVSTGRGTRRVHLVQSPGACLISRFCCVEGGSRPSVARGPGADPPLSGGAGGREGCRHGDRCASGSYGAGERSASVLYGEGERCASVSYGEGGGGSGGVTRSRSVPRRSQRARCAGGARRRPRRAVRGAAQGKGKAA